MLSFFGDFYGTQVFDISEVIDGDYVLNLEAPIQAVESEPFEGKINLLISNPECFSSTFNRNLVAVNLANNHIFDYGLTAYESTLNVLEKSSIGCIGVKSPRMNSIPWTYMTGIGKRVAVLGYCCSSTNPSNINGRLPLLDIQTVISELDVLKKADPSVFVVIQLHYGMEEISFPTPSDVRLSRAIIDSGADLIVGHHAHVVQSWETYRGKRIYYGLGNFIFEDFNLPSYYVKGKPTKLSRKINKERNKVSMKVTLDKDLNITHRWMRFNGRKVSYIRKPSFSSSLIFTRSSVFNAFLFISQRYRMLKIILIDPRKISISRIRYFLINK